MEAKQLEQINNLSKDELIERINSHFGNQAKSSLVFTILWGIIAILSLYTSEFSIQLLCLWILVFLMYFFQFLEYRKMSKEDSAKGLLTRYDRYKKRNLYLISIIIILLCIGIYKVLAAPSVVEWIFCIIFGIFILYLVWYLFSSNFRNKIDNSGRGNINRFVNRLRELVEQEEGKSEENV